MYLPYNIHVGMHTMMVIHHSVISIHLVAGLGLLSSSTEVMPLCVEWILMRTGIRYMLVAEQSDILCIATDCTS